MSKALTTPNRLELAEINVIQKDVKDIAEILVGFPVRFLTFAVTIKRDKQTFCALLKKLHLSF